MVEKAQIRRVLLAGTSGMLGSDIVKELSSANRKNSYLLFPFNRNELDITSKESIEAAFKSARPDVVINCSAYTNVDGSETHKEEAHRVNALGPKLLAQACKEHNAALIHFSTDYVFDGKSSKGYDENHAKNPINEYGRSKSIGEDNVLHVLGNRCYIIRTSWLFGKNGKNFIEAIRKKSEEGEIQVVNDQHGCPTYTVDLAAAIPELLEQYSPGIYHLTNAEVCTWFEFAQEILNLLHSNTHMIPLSTEQYGSPAKRPKCSILLNTKFKRKLPSWKDALRRYMGDK